MMNDLGGVMLVVVIVMMVVMCGGMVVGAVWGILHRLRLRREASAAGTEPGTDR